MLRWGALAVCCAVCVLPAAADAAAPVVAESGAISLAAQIRTIAGNDELELTLRGPDPGGEQPRFEETDVKLAPIWPDEAFVVVKGVDDTTTMKRLVFGGGVPSTAASVELAVGARTLARVPTATSAAFAGPYAGLIRFFLGEVNLPAGLVDEADDDSMTVRLYDEAGQLLGVPEAPTTSQTQQLLRGRTLSLEAERRARIVPIPGQPARIGTQLCLTLSMYESDLDEVCERSEGPPLPLSISGGRGCGKRPTALAGFVPAQTQRLVAVLGSGRRVSLATRAAPFGRSQRIVVARLPRGEALRRVLAVDGAGHLLARDAAVVAPPDRRCGAVPDGFMLSDETPPALGTPQGTQLVAALPGGPRLVVREQGDALCLGVDRVALDGSDCALVPFNSHLAAIGVIPGRAAVGVFNARVTAVDLTFDDGGVQRVPTIEGDEYSGRWRGAVRFLVAGLPGGRVPTGARLLDAEGRKIGDAFVEPGDVIRTPGRTVLRSGLARLALDSERYPGDPTAAQCMRPLFSGERLGDQECYAVVENDTRLHAIVSCGPRATLLFGVVRRRVKRVELRLASGRVLRPRLVRVPGTTARAFLATVPPNSGVARVRFAGQRKAREDRDTVTTPLLPAAKQCGYEYSRVLF